MRYLLTGLMLATAACSAPRQPDTPDVRLAELMFDGAGAVGPAAQRAHGKRLTFVLGCTGCHGKELQGERFYERYAANLTREMQKLSDSDLERVLRKGVHGGEELWGMPSELFQHLSDPDMAALKAYLRNLKPAGKPNQPHLPWEPETKKLIAKGEWKSASALVRETKSLAPVDLGPQHALGRYITRVTCAECHGPELKGIEGDTPDLIVAGGYSREEFERLMTQGVPTGGRKLKRLMADVAQVRFSQLTQRERDALYAYLKARAERPQ